MTKYTLKRKLYADDNQGSGMGMGTKLLLGAGTLAAGFGAAKAGMLGSTLGKGANKLWASAGKTMGSQSMINSGAKGYGNAVARASENAGKSARELVGVRNTAQQEILNTYKLPTK